MGMAGVGTTGTLSTEIIRKDAWMPDAVRRWNPRSHLGQYAKACMQYLPTGVALELLDKLMSTTAVESSLRGRVYRNARWNPTAHLWDLRPARLIDDLGLLCTKVVTTAGVNFIVDAFQNITEVELMKFHGIGTGSTAPAIGDTALVTELTTQYNPDSTRATGSTTEGASNVYVSVGTNTVDATAAIQEHGIFSQAATGGGTLLDRFTFTTVNLASGDSLQTTFNLTFTAGS